MHSAPPPATYLNLDLPSADREEGATARVSHPLSRNALRALSADDGRLTVGLAIFHALLLRYTRTGDSRVRVLSLPGEDGVVSRASVVRRGRELSFRDVVAALKEGLDEDDGRSGAARPAHEFIVVDGAFLPGEADEVVDPDAADLRVTLHAGARPEIVAEVRTDRISEGAARRLLEHFEVLLLDAHERPEAAWSELALVPAEEAKLITSTWNDTTRLYPQNASIAALFSEWAERTPEAVAVEGQGGSLSYRALDALSDRVAVGLDERGVGPGAIVGVALDRTPDLVVSLLGILKTGAAYLPMEPGYPDGRLELMLTDAESPLLITDATGAARFRSLSGAPPLFLVDSELRGSEVEGAEETVAGDAARDMAKRVAGRSVPSPDTGGEDLAYVIYTSGSTGRPKGVRARHRGVTRLVRGQEFATFHPGDRVMAFAPISFDASTLEIWAPLLNGGTVVLVPPGLPSMADLGRFIESRQIDTCWLTAALFHQLVDAGLERLAGLRQLLTGGDVVSPVHARRLLDAGMGITLVNGYGPTENTTFTTCHRMTSSDQVGSTVSIGRPVTNTTVHVLDPEGGRVPVGVPGELYAGGAGVADGYLNRPELTAERFVPDPLKPEDTLYRTGDLVRWLYDGTLEYLGRIDHQVKIDGYRVELGEVETRLLLHPSVREAVVGVLEQDGARRLIAHVVVEADPAADVAALPDSNALREFCAEALPGYMVPSFVVFLDALPVTANGKVDRGALPDPAELRGAAQEDEDGGAARADRARGPGNASERESAKLEHYLAEVWSRLLGVARVGPAQGFFDLGGTSLLSLRVIEEIRSELGVEVPVATFYQHATVRSLAEWIAETMSTGEGAADPGPLSEDDAEASSRHATPEDHRVAIIGMAGRFPGADSVQELWEMLHAERDGRVEYSDEELRAAGVPDERIADPDYVKASYPLEGALDFDAEFFGMLPREAELMDPQQRLFLELAWTAVEHAGYDPRSVPGRVGVFGGVGRNSYLINNLSTHDELADVLAEHPGLVGNLNDFPTTHVSFRLGFDGPSIDVQTACSTSGVAVHMAVRSLLSGESDVALAGGCKILVPNRVGYPYMEGGALSAEGRIRAFDADADGMVRGSGGAMLVLKRYAEAVRDGDNILGVVLGTAVNNDGADRAGFAAPSPAGQARVIASALRAAGVSAETIDHVEAHGTGTILGDPIEVAGLTLAFGETTDRTQFCALGSIKSTIGHLDAGATAAGLVKTLLAFQHEALPATLNFESANPHIDFARTPFFVNAEARPWPRSARPRRAGVSSFGLGGTNAHIVLEEPPLREAAPSVEPGQLLVLSARTPAALNVATERLARHLEAAPDAEFADIARTLQVGRHRFDHRRVVAAATREQAIQLLRSADRSRVTTVSPANDLRRMAFLFPGQGAQHRGMGRGLYRHEPIYRSAMDLCTEILDPLIGRDLRKLIHSDEHTGGNAEHAREELRRTEFAQPALFAHQYAMAELLNSWGLSAAASVGHSIGEYAAACLAGVFELEDALGIVALRGRMMQELPGGSMAAVPLDEQEVLALLPDGVSLAAVNGVASSVVSGPDEAVDAFLASLAEEGHETRRLQTSHAFHSAMMESMVDPFRDEIARIRLAPPSIPFVSTVTGEWITPGQATDPDYWARQIREPVRFASAVSTLIKDEPAILLDVGPGRTAASLARRLPDARTSPSVAALRHPDQEIDDRLQLLQAVGTLWAYGAVPDWGAVDGNRPIRRVPLPTYPFERGHHEIPPADRASSATVEPLVATRKEVDMPVPRSRPRIERIAEELREVLFELSGIQPDELDSHATFLELGFDSLFLAQANGALKKRFKVNVGVRRLLDMTPSVDELSRWLDGELPADFFAPEPTTVQGSGADASGAPGAAGPASAVEGLIRQQIALMHQQLALVTGGAAPGSVQGATTSRDADRSATAEAGLRASPVPREGAGAQAGRGADRVRAHGPWRPVDRDRRTLNSEQQAALDDLVARVQARTAGSKAFMAEHRATLADARSVVGFRSEWKELVYQIVAESASGGRIRDVDGNEYVDVVGAFGVNFLGHSPDFVTEAVEAQLRSGFAIGPQTRLAGEVAALVSELTGMERVSFCNTGSEAVLAALRIARTVTGRDRIATFSGHYHGVFDEVLVKAVDIGDRRSNFPLAPGIPQHAVDPTLVLDYGDPASLDRIREAADELACVILEPVRSRNPSLQPVEFLRQLRSLTRELGIPLIFDEMITGFRAHLGGAQALFGVEADIAAYGKVVGGGYPIGVVAGRAEYMDALDGGPWEFGDDSVPEADMTWFAGTFVRHPVAMAAAKASLSWLKAQGPQLQENLSARTERWVAEMNDWFEANDVPIEFESFSSFFLPSYTVFQQYSDLFPYYLLTRGVFSRETRPLFWSVAHTDEDWEQVTRAYRESALEMKAAGLMTGREAEQGIASVDGAEVNAPREPDPSASAPGAIPLTEPQREVWVAAQFGDDASAAFNLSVRLKVTGALDVEAMRSSIRRLVARHEALRATFDAGGELQTIHPEIELDVPVVELKGDDPDREAEELERREIAEPFDLRDGPLVRARILQLSPTRWRVLILVHHIVADGWACGILAHDLGAVYSAEVRGVEPELRPVMQLSEYVRYLDSDEEREERRIAEAFWTSEFETLPPPLELPTDRPRPPVKTYEATRICMPVEAERVQQVRTAAAGQGATFFAFAFAAFDAWLNRITGQDDIVVGFDLAGQALLPGRDLVCHAVSFLPLRARVDPSASFSELLRDVRGGMLDVIDHQRLTVGTLLQQVRVAPDPSRPPLISVAFNLDPTSLALELADLEVESGSIPRRFENNDLFINLVQLEHGGLELQCTYNVDLFDEATIHGRMREYLALLLAAAEAPETRIAELPITGGDEGLPPEEWNATEVTWPNATLHGLFEEQVARAPDALAVSAPEASVTSKLSYAELSQRADALAARLQKLGVGRDVPVVVSMHRSAELVVSLLAVLKAGGAYVPVDPEYPAERRALMIEDCGAPLVLTQAALVPELPPGTQHLAVDDIWSELQGGETPEGSANPEDLAYIIYTSGSTGRPKGVMVEHRAIVNRIRWMQQHFELDESDVVLQKTPYSFDVSVWEFFWPLAAGARLVMARPGGHMDPAWLARIIQDAAVTTLHFVPSMLSVFLEEPAVRDLAGLERVICSGEALAPDLRDRFFDRIPSARLWNLYGPTEAAVDVTVHECVPGGSNRTVPIGRPIANTRLYVLDEARRRLPIGTPGELYIGGVQVARGYLGREDLTRERFLEDPFVDGGRVYRTGDLARWNADGELEFLGRLDHQVKIRGFRIELGEIEATLESLDGVRQAVVITREVTPGDWVLVGYIVGDPADEHALRDALARQLPEYMIPQYLVALDQMPMSPSGKVARDRLPDPERPSVDDASFQAPETETQRALAAIWCDVLTLERVGLEDSFFDLGGHSILATRVMSRVRDTLGVSVPLRRIFITPTVRGLADEIELRAAAHAVAGDGSTSETDEVEEIAF